MSLKRLSLWNCNDLLPVLQDQPELEELRLKWCSATLENLEKTDVPKLRHLCAELHQAACLVPGRPIEHLSLDTGFGALHFDEQLFDKLSLSAKPITEFSGILICPWEDEMTRSAIRAIARNLPSVERLTLDIGGSISGLVAPLGTEMFELSPRREPPWDVVDHKEVAPIPSYLPDSGVTIVSILPNDISRTFTFHCPSKVQSPRKTHSRSSSVSSISSLLTLSRSSSNASSGGESTASHPTSRKSKEDIRPTEFSPQSVRDAIVFARNELLGSVELRKQGANVFFFEGWSVTKFRKGSSDQYRLQVCYTGRPAKAIFPSGDVPPTFPPFLDVTEGW
ncbi:hypothetical protein FRC01_013445 [Tulasnella sp. 417]|nr:hypothetical protein FRC01_013445 [Tulasnella sp. 417]